MSLPIFAGYAARTRRFFLLMAGIGLLLPVIIPVWIAMLAWSAEGLKVQPEPPASAPKEASDYLQYSPYNTSGDAEIDLTRLEVDKYVRSEPVLSPDRQFMAYSEVLFTSNTHQVFTRLYLVPIQPVIRRSPEDPLPPLSRTPAEKQGADTPGASQSLAPLSSDIRPQSKKITSQIASHFKGHNKSSSIPSPEPPDTFMTPYDPNRTLSDRILIHEAGQDRTHAEEFKTLTVVDWSASKHRLLVKQKNGILHFGLKTSDVLVYDQPMGTVTRYPEIRRIIAYYWDDQRIIPALGAYDWDLFPLGWEPGSDSRILIKAWAYTPHEKKFLGLWRFDIDASRAELLNLRNEAVSVASNGLRVTPDLEKYRQDRMHALNKAAKFSAKAKALTQKTKAGIRDVFHPGFMQK